MFTNVRHHKPLAYSFGRKVRNCKDTERPVISKVVQMGKSPVGHIFGIRRFGILKVCRVWILESQGRELGQIADRLRPRKLGKKLRRWFR